MSGGRPRQPYGRSATTCYTNILTDSSGDILNKCSNLFSKLTSRVRSSSQTADERLLIYSNGLSSSAHKMSNNPPPRVSSYSQYPMLLKYSKYDDSSRYDKYSDLKNSPRYDDPSTSASRYKPRSTGLTPSASFSSFSTFKSDYGSTSDYPRRETAADLSSKPTDLSTRAGKVDAPPEEGGYGLKGIYSNASSSNYIPNHDKIGSRYRPSRFLKSNLLKGRCDEGDEDAFLTRGLSSKQPDYWSHYTAMSPTYLMDKYSTKKSHINSPQLRQKYGLDSVTTRQRPVTVPEQQKSPRTRILESSPDNTAAILRRRECAQLINMYSLPLDTLQNIDKSRKFRKRVQDAGDGESTTTSRFDQVKQMAAQVSCLRADDDTSFGPPRKVLYGSASTGDMLSSLSKGSGGPSSGTPSQPSLHSTSDSADSDKFVLHEAPIVFEKAAMKEKPISTSSRPSYLYLSDHYDKYPYSSIYSPGIIDGHSNAIKSPVCSSGGLSNTTSSDPSTPLSNVNINVTDTSSSASSYTNDTSSTNDKTKSPQRSGVDSSSSSNTSYHSSGCPLPVSTYSASVRTKYIDTSHCSRLNHIYNRDNNLPQDLSFSTFKPQTTSASAVPATYVAGVAYVEASQPKPTTLTYVSSIQPKPSVAGISYVTTPESKPESLCLTVKTNALTTTTLTDMSPKADNEDAYALAHYKSLMMKGVGMGQKPTVVYPQDPSSSTNGTTGTRNITNTKHLTSDLSYKTLANNRCNNLLTSNVDQLHLIPVVSGSSKSSKFSSLYGSSSVSSDDVSSQGPPTLVLLNVQ